MIPVGCGFREACGSFRRTLESVKAPALREPLAGLPKFRKAVCDQVGKLMLEIPRNA